MDDIYSWSTQLATEISQAAPGATITVATPKRAELAQRAIGRMRPNDGLNVKVDENEARAFTPAPKSRQG